MQTNMHKICHVSCAGDTPHLEGEPGEPSRESVAVIRASHCSTLSPHYHWLSVQATDRPQVTTTTIHLLRPLILTITSIHWAYLMTRLTRLAATWPPSLPTTGLLGLTPLIGKGTKQGGSRHLGDVPQEGLQWRSKYIWSVLNWSTISTRGGSSNGKKHDFSPSL